MIAALYNKIRAIFDAEHDRLILWAPVLMGAGVAWYFALADEPPLWLGAAAFLACGMLAHRMRRHAFLRYALLAAAFVALGFALSQWRTHSVHSPYLTAPLPFAHVMGRVADIEPTPKGSKLTLEDVTIDKLTPQQTPHRIHLTLRSYDAHLVTGQVISLRAGLFPPPQPATPGGFDFGQHYYFLETGAVGYGIPPIAVKPLTESGGSSFSIWFAEFRHRLTEAIRSYFREPAGAVAAAFVTGETQAIPDAVNDNMRVAGLYHLLAVSGMNLSVVAGLAFFSLRLLLAAVPPLALRYNIKKWAALLALLASYIYLRVSGSPVSVERAFVMVSLIFVAILLDRDPSPMRSVAAAAFLIILWEPEAALSASFQLSFSATAALIASYEWGSGAIGRLGKGKGTGLPRLLAYFAAVMATSLVAWLGTEPFIIYHFNQFSSYSLLANTIAEPLVSFLLMPLVIAGVLLLPFGLAWLAFTPMQYGVDALIGLAHWVAGLPHAMWIVPSPTDTGFALVVLGIAWVYFWKTRWRWLGLPMAVVGLATAALYVPPDVLISGDGKHVAVRRDDGRLVMLRGRPDSFLGQQWARAVIEHDTLDKKEIPVRCDAKGCVLSLRGHIIALPRVPEALGDDCASADIVIATGFAVAPAACGAATLMDEAALESGGVTALWFEGRRVAIRQARSRQGHRPWASEN